MREIKFRAWSTSSEEMYMLDPSIKDGAQLFDLYEGNSGTWKVMQFTGLHDKEGVEIYEGDIINILAPIGAEEGITLEGVWDVFYSQPCPGEAHYWGMHSKRGNYRLSGPALAFSEVIGNIHQHPELMEGV